MNIETYELIDKETIKSVLSLVKLQDNARWVKHESNYGLNGEVGDYYALFDNCMSQDLRYLLIEIAPDHAPLELLKIVVNHYRPGGYIPMHIDAGAGLGCEMLCLTENVGQGLKFVEDDKEIFIQDKSGYCNKFKKLNTIHGVDKVDTDRYSVVFIFR